MPQREIKESLNGGLDQDTSPYLLKKDRYIDALNITRDSIDGGHDSVVTNVISNRLVDYELPTGTNITIGAFPFPLRNTVIEFLYNSTGYNSIIEYDNSTRQRMPIFISQVDSDTDILNFTRDGKITGVNIYASDDGDLLFFLDSLGRPTTLNIARFKAGEYTPVTRDIIDVAKMPPLSPPDAVYDNDASRRVNNCRTKFFKFAQLWIYDDNEESTLSPQSAMPVPTKILDDTYSNEVTNNNVIRLSLQSGPKNVKSVRLLVSYVEKTNVWSNFSTVEVINKAENSIPDDSDFAFSFFNDSTYPVYNEVRAIQLFDCVPTTAGAQEMANGNTLELADISEGLSRTINPNVVNVVSTIPAGNGGAIGSLNGVVTLTPVILVTRTQIVFSGVPATGTIVNIFLITKPGGVQTLVGTYTTIAGDVATDVVNGLVASLTTTGLVSLISGVGSTVTFFFTSSAYDFDSLEITPPGLSAATDSIPTWKWSTERNIGIAYFNEKGVTNGILYNAKIVFPAYAENGGFVPLIPFINTKIYHQPPLWAVSYQFYFTKEPTKYLFYETINVNTSESANLYFDVSNIALNQLKNPTTAQVLNYSFADGDRMRLIRRMSDNTVYADTYDAPILGLVINPKINNVQQTANFIKIKKTAPFNAVDYSSKFFVIEIYRPGQQVATGEKETYFEFGEEWPILNPGTDDRVHGGQVTDQSVNFSIPAEFNFYEGDSYFRSRTVPLSETGVGVFNVQDRNVVDFYESAVSSISGRPNLIDINSFPTRYVATIRFSLAIQPNTNINKLNQFFPDNFIDCDARYGAIKMLRGRDRGIRVFQELKVGNVPIFSEIRKDDTGNNVLYQTDKLLNPVIYYSGDWGIGDNSTSLASFDFADYFTTNIKGAVCRISNDGIDPISNLYGMNSWAVQNLPYRSGTFKVYGVFNQATNSYIISLEERSPQPAQTLSFSEKSNSFESFLSYQPEMMCTLGTLLITFKGGQLYTHDDDSYNNFYGVQYPSSITTVWNENSAIKKTFNAIGYQSEKKWSSPTDGDIQTSMINPQTSLVQISNVKAVDYEEFENVFTAAFNRDANSMTDPAIAVLEGDYLKGTYIKTKLILAAEDATLQVALFAPYINYSISQRNL